MKQIKAEPRLVPCVACGSMTVLLLTLSFVMSAAGKTWYVSPDGTDGAAGDSWHSPFKTIQAAVSAASAGDTVVLSNGVYALAEPVLIDKKLAVRGFDDGNGRPSERVVVDGQNRTGCLAFLVNAENEISGLTIRNGRGAAYVPGDSTLYPGGLYLKGGSAWNVRILDCKTVLTTEAPVNARGGGLCSYGGFVRNVDVHGCGIEVTTSAASVGSCYGGGAYVQGRAKDCVISNCSVVVRAPNCTEDSTVAAVGGGLMLETGSVSESCRILDCAAILESESGTSGVGGGVALFGAYGTPGLSNSLVAGCTASRSGGGVAVRGFGTVSACTVSNNLVAARVVRDGSLGGGGIDLDDYSAPNRAKVVRDCLIADNVVSNVVSRPSAWCLAGGGGLRVSEARPDAPVRIVGCLVRNNAAWAYGGGIFFRNGGRGTDALVVSNCWFSGNRAALRGGFAYVTCPAGALVADCRIDGSSAGKCLGVTAVKDGHVLVRHADGGNADNDFTLRSCFLTGNNPNGESGELIWLFKGSAGNSPLVLDHCTLAGNIASPGGRIFTIVDGQGYSLANLSVRGCVIARNSGYGLLNCSTDETSKYPTLFTASYFDRTEGLVTDGSLVQGNLWPANTPDPKFRNADAGDFRLDEGSPLLEVGGEPVAWMGEWKRRSASRDMGDGSFSVSWPEGAVWGVSLVRHESCPRLSGLCPDMGCFERWKAPGGLLLVR